MDCSFVESPGRIFEQDRKSRFHSAKSCEHSCFYRYRWPSGRSTQRFPHRCLRLAFEPSLASRARDPIHQCQGRGHSDWTGHQSLELSDWSQLLAGQLQPCKQPRACGHSSTQRWNKTASKDATNETPKIKKRLEKLALDPACAASRMEAYAGNLACFSNQIEHDDILGRWIAISEPAHDCRTSHTEIGRVAKLQHDPVDDRGNSASRSHIELHSSAAAAWLRLRAHPMERLWLSG